MNEAHVVGIVLFLIIAAVAYGAYKLLSRGGSEESLTEYTPAKPLSPTLNPEYDLYPPNPRYKPAPTMATPQLGAVVPSDAPEPVEIVPHG